MLQLTIFLTYFQEAWNFSRTRTKQFKTWCLQCLIYYLSKLNVIALGLVIKLNNFLSMQVLSSELTTFLNMSERVVHIVSSIGYQYNLEASPHVGSFSCTPGPLAVLCRCSPENKLYLSSAIELVPSRIWRKKSGLLLANILHKDR